MKKMTLHVLFCALLLTMSSFVTHKFYVSIYKIEQNASKKRIEITSRIFVDDLNKALSKYAGQKTQIGEKTETQKDIDFFKSYMSEKIKISINGAEKSLQYKSSEIVGNQLVCYFIIPNIPKLKTFEIQNTALFEIDAHQQNIVNTSINKKKQSLVLVQNNAKGLLKF